MTIRPRVAHESTKPFSWWAAIAFSGSKPYLDTPWKETSRDVVRVGCVAAPAVGNCSACASKAAAWVTHKGPIGGFLMTRLGPMWITPSLVAVHTTMGGESM